MRSWLYRHPTWAWLLSLIGFLVSVGVMAHGLLDWDGWWRLGALGWGWWAVRCYLAVSLFWERS